MRHVTIPDGWTTVSIPDDRVSYSFEMTRRLDNQLTTGGVAVDLIAARPPSKIDSRSPALVESARLIAIEPPGPVSGFQREPGRYVLMVMPEQQSGIEEMLQTDEIRFGITLADEEWDTPVLHEETLEEFRQPATSDDAEGISSEAVERGT